MNANTTAVGESLLAQRQSFYAKIAQQNYAPLWEQLHSLVTATPRSACQPGHWPYAVAREYLAEAGKLITAKEAERRVLVLENPGLRGKAAITTALYAGLQMVLPGETAPAHRHSQSALRLVLEGDGAYTNVDGERVHMHRGDFVITPSWAWHDHGNHTDRPMVWLDGLDLPLVGMLDASFCAASAEEVQACIRPEGDALNRYGNAMAPVDWTPPANRASPLFTYPYERTLGSLRTLAATDRIDGCHGYRLRYVNPLTGGYPMPSIGAFAQWLPQGFRGGRCRCSAGSVFALLEGQVTAHIDERTFQVAPNDVFVVPSWASLSLESHHDSVLFSFSDRPVQEALGLWREQRGDTSEGSL